MFAEQKRNRITFNASDLRICVVVDGSMQQFGAGFGRNTLRLATEMQFVKALDRRAQNQFFAFV